MIERIIARLGIWNGWLLMSVFIWHMIVIMTGGKAIAERTHISDPEKEPGFERNVHMIGNLLALCLLIYSIFLPLRTGTTLLIIGLILYAAGVIILALATYTFMRTPLDIIIDSGVYRISRHPMYLSSFLIWVGVGLAVHSWIFLLVTAVMFFVFHREALLEERICQKVYGEEYSIYMYRIPRWIGLPRSK